MLSAFSNVFGWLTVIIFMVVARAGAQPAVIIRVKNGKDATKSVSVRDRFQFGQFVSGRLVYSNGKTARASLNYCYVMGEVMFIDLKGDTLLIADNHLVDHAEIGNLIFHASSSYGYQQILDTAGGVMLARKVQYKIAGIEKKGAYNGKNEQGAISNAGNYTDPNTGLSVVLPESNSTVLMRPAIFYFFIDNNNRTYKADRRSLLKIFSRNKSVVEKFLRVENINFNSEEDLKRVIHFCVQLVTSKNGPNKFLTGYRIPHSIPYIFL